MKGFLLLFTLAFAIGGLLFAPVLFVAAAVLFSGYAIVDAVADVLKELKSNGSKLDRLGAALATPPEIVDETELGAVGATDRAESYLVQLSDGVRGTFTHPQLESLLGRGIIDSRAFILPAGAASWIRVSDLTAPHGTIRK